MSYSKIWKRVAAARRKTVIVIPITLAEAEEHHVVKFSKLMPSLRNMLAPTRSVIFVNIEEIEVS